MRYAIALACAFCALCAPALGARTVSVSGNHLVDGQGHTMRLLGANRSGTEYACSEGWGFTDSPNVAQPDSNSLIAAMKTWRIRAVRVPLNEACWLRINGVSAQWGGANYRSKVITYVHRLEAAGINPILDLHVVDPKNYPADRDVNGLRPLPDRQHALPFWARSRRRSARTARSSSTSTTSPTTQPGAVCATAASSRTTSTTPTSPTTWQSGPRSSSTQSAPRARRT